jgi:chromosome segregation ATPase
VEHSKRPPRRPSKRTEPASARARPAKPIEPTDDSPLALLKAQLERAEASREATERALADEKEARAGEAAQLGEMMAHLSRVEARARATEDAFQELRSHSQEERRRAVDMEAEIARLRINVEASRSAAEARAEELEAALALREKDLAAAHAAGIDAQWGRPETGAGEGRGEVAELQGRLQESRAEASKLRESLEALRKRAGTIGAGLQEMRELMVQSAALFDDLEDREHAIAEIRARSLREARALFLRAAGHGPVPPPLPRAAKTPVDDLSEAAELLEEEVRASLRPKPVT